MHRHFGSALLIAPDAPIVLPSREADPVTSYAALVAPNAWHRVDSRNSRILSILLGPDHPWFCYLKPLLSGTPIVPLDITALATREIDWDSIFDGSAGCASMRQFVQHVLETYGGTEVEPHRIDARISEVLQILEQAGVDTPTPDELGRRVALSGNTLMRRFKSELGVRIREYVLWRRLMSGLALVDGSRTVADIAQRIGFYDQAHLARTARRMVELAPSFVNDFSQTRVHLCTECE